MGERETGRMTDNLEILIKARDEAAKRVEQDPTAENLAALEKATKMMADLQVGEPEPSVKNRLEVMKHLRREGFKIGKTKLYKDAGDGLLRIQSDGTVLERDIDRYVRISGLKKPAEISDAELQLLQKKKNEMEVEKLTQQVSDLKFKQGINRGLYISKAEFELEFAAKIAVLKDGLEFEIHSSAHDLVELIKNSDSESAKQKLIDKRLQDLSRQFNFFANIKKFEVVFKEEDSP